MPAGFSEVEIMQRIFESDKKAIGELYDKYSSLLFTFIKKILKDNDLTENILMEVFLIVYKRINYFNFNTRNPYTWLITLTKNRVVFELRKKEGLKETSFNPLQEENFIPKLSHLAESLDLERTFELKNKIENALNKLTEAQQYVIYLAFYEGQTQEAIAEKLKIPVSTVRSKVKTSLINLNENFTEKSSHFTVKNDLVEMIYPYALGCLSYEEESETYSRFKASEPFPWKVLGEYQNLAALLPIILDLEKPSEEIKEKLLNRIYHLKSMKSENKLKSFEQVSSTSSRLNISHEEENFPKERFERIENFEDEIDEEKIEEKTEEKVKRNPEDFEPVIPFKPKTETRPEYVDEPRPRNYSSLIIIGLIVFYLVSAVMAYLYYQDRTLFYETEIENLSKRVETLSNEFQNRPEIPGLDALRNPKTVELTTLNGSISSGEIIFSYEDKRGY
ncbi:MAG TPA: sigma-70 family RNA polymerase sigma factor, partial [Ignavibacteriaceae bacterium]|nr:sigma-70 family RNA polymerase sigma factor [Ignavibacteriaceae bacterium]